MIAKEYLTTWFFVDFISVIPFDLILMISSLNRVTRIARIGRLYRLIRLIKMIRIFKVVQSRRTMMKKVTQKFQIGIGVERLLFLTLLFFILQHVAACLW